MADHRVYRERDYEFGRRVLALRSATALTQAALAELLGVSRTAVVAWEGGESHPTAPHLRHLIEACLERGAFHQGQESDEIRALWQSADVRLPLDEIWLAELLSSSPAAAAGDARAGDAGTPSLDDSAARPAAADADWGPAPAATEFYGRDAERALLTKWLTTDSCRVVSVLGIGGVGKTALAARLAHELAPRFERLYWRSLRDAPPPTEWLAGAIGFLSDHKIVPPPGEAEHLATLLSLLRARRCLLVLDNFETALEPGRQEGHYRTGLAGYGRLLHALAETSHESCLLITSREAPPELALLGSALGILELGGLGVAEAESMLAAKRLSGSPEDWAELVTRLGGNGLALKLVGERIRDLFAGGLALYLKETGTAAVFGGVRELLDEQVERGTAAELALLRVLAVAREPLPLVELLDALGPRLGRETVIEALEALRRRSLVDRLEAGAAIAFTLQSVVLEYVTERLVTAVAGEIAAGSPGLLAGQALIRAQAKDYVRETQERLIGAPILAQLQGRLGREETERRLLALLDAWRSRPAVEQDHGPGNVIDLLRLLRGDLRGLDLSCLVIRQAYLAQSDAQGANLTRAHLAEAVLADGFTSAISVAVSGDGALLAAGTSTGQVWLWRVADRALLATLEGQSGQVFGVALSADGRLLASGDMDGTVRLWDTGTGRLLATFEGHRGGVAGVALSADGRLLASGSFDQTVRLWETDTARPLATLEGHSGGVWSVALSTNGDVLASGSADGTIRLWQSPDGAPRAILTGHTGEVWSVALSGDGRLLASASLDETVRLWRTEDGRLLETLPAHTSGAWRVALSADGRLLASSGGDMTVRLWEAPSGRPLAILQGQVGGGETVALSADGHLVASSDRETVRLWEAPSGLPLATFQGHTDGVWRVALSGDGDLVASTANGGEGSVRIWEARSGRLLATLRGHAAGQQVVVAFCTDGDLVASGGVEGTVRLWDARSGRLLATLAGHTSEVWGVALSADGHLVASCGLDETVRLWESPSGRPLATLEGHARAVRVVALSADGRLLASGDAEGMLRLWETPAGRSLAAFEGHSGGVRGVALSGDGGLLASGGLEGTVRLWETRGGRRLAELAGHTGPVWGVALSADGRLIASSSADGTVRLWEARTGRPLATLQGHAGPIPAVALTRDGRLVASGGWDGTIRLWETADGAPLRTLRPDRRYEGMDITGLTGVTDAQRAALIALGAIENEDSATPGR